MSRFIVSICRVEHHIYELEVEADTAEVAEELASEVWDDNDEAFDHRGIAHVEVFTQEIKKLTEENEA